MDASQQHRLHMIAFIWWYISYIWCLTTSFSEHTQCQHSFSKCTQHTSCRTVPAARNCSRQIGLKEYCIIEAIINMVTLFSLLKRVQGTSILNNLTVSPLRKDIQVSLTSETVTGFDESCGPHTGWWNYSHTRWWPTRHILSVTITIRHLLHFDLSFGLSVNKYDLDKAMGYIVILDKGGQVVQNIMKRMWVVLRFAVVPRLI